MKKIAFYVEGQTEALFLKQLLYEIAGKKNIQMKLVQFQGNGKSNKVIIPEDTNIKPNHYALIYDCMGDNRIVSQIHDDHQRLFAKGYSEIIGIRDLYPITHSDLPKLERSIRQGVSRNGRVVIQPLPTNTSVIIAVSEIESWFLAECSHFQCIDTTLTPTFIKVNLGFDPCNDDMTLRTHPANDLHKAYQLGSPRKAYTKTKKNIERTIDCLDFTDIYLNLKNKIPQLEYLINKIDNFLT